MTIEILSTVDNKLFDRKEIEVQIAYGGPTPKRAEIKQLIGGKVGANPELMILRSVSSNFGKQMVKVVAHVYANKEMLMKTEPHYIKVREGMAEKKAKKAKAAAPAKKKKDV
ncbi:hypothetical protein HY988_05285 [Candidatus Micrarchaeota archaeon]|nr:hypothetical protein [Candidatus Micrarchaeota archaeon]